MKWLLFILLFLPLGLLPQSNCTIISDGTYGNTQTSPFTPLYGLYNYSWSSSIYYASDIGVAKTISSISWYVDEYQNGYSQTGPYTYSNVKIYFAYTTLSGWSNISNVSGINRLTGVNVSQGITSWTKVYDGPITFNTCNAWTTIPLTSTFSYDGVTNLVVHVENWDGAWGYGYPYFHYTSTSSSSLRTTKYGYQDASMGPTAGTRAYTRPDITFCVPSALPIELLYFKPKYEDDIVKIRWSTASEHNNDYFTIEKSYDGINYEVIKTVPGAGNSTHVIDYYEEDRVFVSSIVYYRLKQTDFDGKYVRTDWESVFIDKKVTDLEIRPNPFDQELNISFISDINGIKTLNLTDLIGNVVYQEDIMVFDGVNNIKIKLNTLSRGVYLLNFDKMSFKVEHN